MHPIRHDRSKETRSVRHPAGGRPRQRQDAPARVRVKAARLRGRPTGRALTPTPQPGAVSSGAEPPSRGKRIMPTGCDDHAVSAELLPNPIRSRRASRVAERNTAIHTATRLLGDDRQHGMSSTYRNSLGKRVPELDMPSQVALPAYAVTLSLCSHRPRY